MATITQTKLVGFGYGNKTNYNATNYANHIWFDPTNKQILLNGIEYIPKKLSELVNDGGFLTSANFKIENTSTTAVKKITIGNVSGNFYTFDQGVSGNMVLAGATSSSSNTGATFRKLVEADIPALSIGKITNLQSTLDTKLSSITKSMVENVLTGNITSHTHFSISTEGDNRNVATTPNDYSNKFVFKGLKFNSQIGSPSGDTYSFLLGLRGWSDSSAGQSHELAFNNSGIYRRQGATTEWGSWYNILDSGNFNSYAATKDHTHTFASITSKPTTLENYGFTDAMRFYTTDEADYLAARFNNTALATKAANTYIEFWQTGAGWFNLMAGKFITNGGTSSQFLKGDGSLDSNTYALSSALGNYLPLTGGTLSGALTCNGDYINMNNDSGSRGYRGFFNQSGSANRAIGSHIFMYGGGQALGTNSVSIGYQAYAGIRNEDADKTTYPYIAWKWMPTEKFSVGTTNSATLSGGEYYGFPLLPNEMVQWNIGGQNVIYENSSKYTELLVVIKASDADTGLVFGGKTTLPYRASKTLIAGKYIVGAGEYLKNITEFTINNVKYYQVIIYTWNTTAFPTSYDFTQQVKVMCATKVNNSNYNGASSYASGYSSVASGNYSVASGYSSVASGNSSVASGNYSVASGNYSVASGNSSVASGNYSVASGSYSVASGVYSVASGYSSVASGVYSVASGYSSVASGNYSVASGYSSVASGAYSVASGTYSVASGKRCVVLARNGETMSNDQTIVGTFNAKVAGLFIIGNGTSDTARSNAFVVDDSGNVTAKYFSGYANAIGGEGIKVYASNANEINFGGTSSVNGIYFGYRSMDSRPTPTIYNFGNGTATIQAASFSGNAATATNADTLDGYHEIKFFRHRGEANSTSISYPPTSSDLANITGIGSYVVQHSGHTSHLLNFNCESGSTQYIQFLADYGNRLLFRCSTDSNLAQPWKVIAFTDSSITGNAATATKLKTPRTLWGNSFDGSGNVSGSLTFLGSNESQNWSLGMEIGSSYGGFIGFSKVFGEEGVGNFTGISLGWGANPETDAASVRINDKIFTYKSYPILHSNNFSDYAPTKTGGGASGTWGISISGNAATATKLGSADVGTLNTPIYLKSGAAMAVSSIKESLLTYGMDSNFSGTVSPIDMGVSNLLSANRIAFGNPNGVTVEYSTDGGVNWLDYGATNTQKTRLISGLGHTFYIGGSNATTTVSTLFMLRITLNAVNLRTYTRPRKALIYVSTDGATSCTVDVEAATLGNQTSFTPIGTYAISGWSGWNSIPLGAKTTFGGDSTQTSNNGAFRFTFSIGELSSSSSNRLSVSDIAIYGETYWTTPSTLARTGHIYTYDASQNVTFPKKVTASSLALSATDKISDIGTNIGTFGKDVNILLNDSEKLLNLNNLFNSFAVTIGESTSSIFGHITGLREAVSTLTSNVSTLQSNVSTLISDVSSLHSVATATSDGLMSSAMFGTKFVDSVGVKQGLANTSVDGTVEVLSRSIYIRPHKNNVGGGYTDIEGNWDVAIPNATKDYDGSMSYTDKRKISHVSDNGHCTVASVFTMNVNGTYSNLDALDGVEFSVSNFAGMSDIIESESTQPEFIRLKLSSTNVVYGYTLYETYYSGYAKYVCYPHNSEIVYDGGMVYIQPIS